MAQYKYVKEVPLSITIPVIPVVSLVVGFAILFWVLFPILSFKLFYKSSYTVSPLAQAFAAQEANVQNWLPKGQSDAYVAVDTYEISIPKIKIEDAKVKIGGDDLSKQLIHWSGTAQPGKNGNGVIFGHSILPQFYNPDNYLSIFSHLPKLEEGDEIFVTYDGVQYKYVVENYRVTSPEDISGLEQDYGDSYLTFVTCVPPGTYLERLWLTAKLTDIDNI